MKDRKKPAIRFKGFTEDWEQRKLGDIFKEYSEKDHEELPALMIIQGGGTMPRDESDRSLLYDKANLANYKMVKEGDFIVHLRSFEGGLEKATNTGIISPAYHTLHGENTDSRFYYSYFRSKKFIDVDLKPHVYGIRDGRSIDIEGMKTVKIPFTNYREQKTIGTFIKQLDRLITLHQCKYNYLLRLKDCIFSIIVKTTWEQRKLGDCFTERVESMPDGELISVTIKDGIKKFSELGRHDNSNDDKSKYKKVCVGDIAYNSMRMWQGASGYSPYEGIVSPAYTVISPNLGIYSKCLAYQFKLPEMIRTFQVNSQGITSDNWNLKYPALSQIEIFVSKDEEEQTQIAEYFANLDNLIALHQCKLKLLKQIKQSMENRLFIKNTTKNRKELENMTFKYESDFEETLINLLSNKGWEKDVIKYPTESELLQNWANILFDNNRGIDRLNNYPLTEGEMQQVLEQINSLRTPIKLNEFINGKTVSIKRDNPDDLEHLGKEVSLKIYDRREIAAGQSRYQIVQQPVFPSKSKILNDRRGDLMLLINGMPVIHIELKKSGIPVSQACNQIEKYSKEGIFTGLFSLVQVFVAMTPNETRYFANPGPDGRFNSDYYFKWADFNNEPINDWKEIASSLLSIPMAHQLIGFYTIADESDGILKVMRSYQYYAANAISDKVAKIKWDESNQRGGFIWHTTGSGKTMTSFKSAQLIADSQEADKVVFLMDRIELGTQSLGEYRGFAGESKGISNEESSIKSTENTYTLISKLKSDSHLDTLIVTSIQKMSRIKDEDDGLKADDIEKINKKRIVFIVDEAHRSTFGEMLQTIKNTFPNSVFFGFTGTPIQDENEKKMSTTISVFGDELHRYSIADGIRDKNVLGFDIYKVMTFRDSDVRRSVAMERAKVKDREDINFDERKKEIYFDYMDSSKVKMAGYTADDGKYIKGIEDYLPNSQYAISEHRNKVIEDIGDKWFDLSRGSKFHAILATSSIPEAIEYYHLFKEKLPWLKTTCLFDPNVDAKGTSEKERDKAQYKQDGLVEIIDDYNKKYEQNFSLGTHAAFKKDLALRLAHKEYYKAIDRQPDKQLDLLIVVDQMLTGFDSKWVNTLYLDKMMEYENIIQAFSRTNRLFGPDKPFGTIRYYRKPHTMERNISQAVSLYSGNKSIGLFVNKIHKNIEKMNVLFADINELFKNANRADFSKLPDDKRVVAKFASLFKTLNEHLEAAKIQGFKWSNPSCEIEKENGEKDLVTLDFDETQYLVLVQRYKEIHRADPESIREDVPFYLEGYITEIDTGRIDSDYMNSRFEKYIKVLHNDEVSKEFKEGALNDLHNTFATLNQEEQKYANIFLHDLQRGDVFLEEGKTFRDYITDYQFKAKNDQIHQFAVMLGLDEETLRNMMDLKLTESTINEFGRLDVLKATKDKDKVKAYFQNKEGIEISKARANIKADKLIREFILKGGIDIE
nr:HsdR family type I site-specific deoxyribonuclease [uncultured Peptostreptococcus sp.]